MENNGIRPSERNYKDAAAILCEITELAIDVETTKRILSLYPQVCIKIAVYDGIGDSDMREGLSFVASDFFLGCRWPTFANKIEGGEFAKLLQQQGVLMGLSPKKTLLDEV